VKIRCFGAFLALFLVNEHALKTTRAPVSPYGYTNGVLRSTQPLIQLMLPDGKWCKGVMWLMKVKICLQAASRVQLFADVGNGWLHKVPLDHVMTMSISCHFRDCKTWFLSNATLAMSTIERIRLYNAPLQTQLTQ